MDTIELWARNGDAVREAMELGDLVHLETSREELTDEFLLFAISTEDMYVGDPAKLLSPWFRGFLQSFAFAK